MIFSETPLRGAYLIELEPHRDERGFFARTFCREEFAQHGLSPEVVQRSISYNRTAGTLRGMHFQRQPFAEAKLVRCVRGGIHDVIVDLREESETYRRSFSVELTAENHRALYIPEELAHGFQTLVDDTEVEYQMNKSHAPEAASGFRYDDPVFALNWPLRVSVITARDLSWPAFT